MNRSARQPVVLSIAGSDSGGLSGIQADLKTFAALGVHGVTAVTALTAQNSREVSASRVVSPALLLSQLDALHADFRIAAVKIGMLGNVAVARAVAGWLERTRLRNIVLDPVVVASSGRRLLSAAGLRVLRDRLLPLAMVVTPNVPEIEALLACRVADAADLRGAALALRRSGARAVLLKGGHARGQDTVIHDLYADARGAREFTHARLPYSARGTGCTLSSAIAAGLAHGRPLRDAVNDAEAYLQRCYRGALPVGSGTARALVHG